MARLSLALLGLLDVRLDGQPITALAYDKVWALLKREAQWSRSRGAVSTPLPPSKHVPEVPYV